MDWWIGQGLSDLHWISRLTSNWHQIADELALG
jgi:hypothetical protein